MQKVPYSKCICHFVDQLKEKQEKTHEAQQRARSQKQLEMAKQANIEKLVSQNNYICPG